MVSLVIKKLASDAQIPMRATNGSAGYDLYSYGYGIIEPYSHTIVDTRISVILPANTSGLIWPRSGLSAKFGVETGAGVIDSDYTGEIKVILHNHSSIPFTYEKGMRIAQLLVMPVLNPVIEEFVGDKCYDLNQTKNNSDLEQKESKRESGGFGSTGLF